MPYICLIYGISLREKTYSVFSLLGAILIGAGETEEESVGNFDRLARSFGIARQARDGSFDDSRGERRRIVNRASHIALGVASVRFLDREELARDVGCNFDAMVIAVGRRVHVDPIFVPLHGTENAPLGRVGPSRKREQETEKNGRCGLDLHVRSYFAENQIFQAR